MEQIAIAAQEVRQHWLAQRLRIEAVSAEDLNKLRLLCLDGRWAEYETFLRVAGLAVDDDRQGIRFWSPHEVRRYGDVLSTDDASRANAQVAVIIADYLQEAWWYCLWLTGPVAGQVSLVLGDKTGNDPRPPIGSLAEFLRAYTNEAPSLYPAD
jgi:hypothetical protein